MIIYVNYKLSKPQGENNMAEGSKLNHPNNLTPHKCIITKTEGCIIPILRERENLWHRVLILQCIFFVCVEYLDMDVRACVLACGSMCSSGTYVGVGHVIC